MRLPKSFQTVALASVCCFALIGQSDRVPNGTEITVRTNDSIDAKPPNEGRIYSAVVDRDVMDRSGRVVIPRGSNAELALRDTSDQEMTLDLESITVDGRRYSVSSTPEPVTATENRREGVGKNSRTGKYVGGGAVLGSIIGAIAGGGKGAALGAAAGAGAGAVGQTVTRGGTIRVPSETLITFRLDRSLSIGPADDGYEREGRHYHRYDRDRRNYR